MLIFPKATGALKLKFYWLNRIPQAASAVMKTSGYCTWTSFRKPLQQTICCGFLYTVCTGFWKPGFIWPQAAFRHPFMAALVAYKKMVWNQEVNSKLYPNFSEPLWQNNLKTIRGHIENTDFISEARKISCLVTLSLENSEKIHIQIIYKRSKRWDRTECRSST